MSEFPFPGRPRLDLDDFLFEDNDYSDREIEIISEAVEFHKCWITENGGEFYMPNILYIIHIELGMYLVTFHYFVGWGQGSRNLYYLCTSSAEGHIRVCYLDRFEMLSDMEFPPDDWIKK